VPLYLVYGANGGEPVILPAILTQGVVVGALDAAAKGR
jgi:thiol:disulfide interchange protein DsbD